VSAGRTKRAVTTATADARLARPLVPDDHVLVLFGATGDLAKHKLLPRLFHLAVAGMMPERYRIVGSGHPEGPQDAEGFRYACTRPASESESSSRCR
jgi:glucose-6-phosphate 1-dehydrogenase